MLTCGFGRKFVYVLLSNVSPHHYAIRYQETASHVKSSCPPMWRHGHNVSVCIPSIYQDIQQITYDQNRNHLKTVFESQKLEDSNHQSNNFILDKRFHLFKDLFTKLQKQQCHLHLWFHFVDF